MKPSRREVQVRAREVAVQALYQFDLSQRGEFPLRGLDDLRTFVQDASDDPGVETRARELLEGILADVETLDERIDANLANWRPERVALVDRSILRLGVHELLDEPDVPPKVAISEAIELAKRFSTEKSGSFVNAVLDRIWHQLESGSSAEEAS